MLKIRVRNLFQNRKTELSPILKSVITNNNNYCIICDVYCNKGLQSGRRINYAHILNSKKARIVFALFAMY